MIRIKLFTRDGGFVTEGEMPPFLTLPDVIVWGERVFIAPQVDAAVRAAEHRAGEVAYVEAFAWAMPVVS